MHDALQMWSMTHLINVCLINVICSRTIGLINITKIYKDCKTESCSERNIISPQYF